MLQEKYKKVLQLKELFETYAYWGYFEVQLTFSFF